MDTIALHLTCNQLCSRVIAHIDGEDYTAEVFGDGHQTRARALAFKVHDALKQSKADALNLLA